VGWHRHPNKPHTGEVTRFERQSSRKSGTLSSFRHFQDMPRYYFNVHNVSPSAGDVGEELPDNESAWRRATVIAGAALFKADGTFRPGQEWALEVTDEARKPIYFIEIAAWQAD
jgi:hypothetical protein